MIFIHMFIYILIVSYYAAADQTSCYAPTGWGPDASCAPCASAFFKGTVAFCTSTQWTPCYSSQEECDAVHGGSDGASSTKCYAMTGWGLFDSCAECKRTSMGGDCVTSRYTQCYESMDDCKAANPQADWWPTQDHPPTLTVPVVVKTSLTTGTTVSAAATTSKASVTTRGTTRTATFLNAVGALGSTEPVNASCWESSCPELSQVTFQRPSYKGPNCYAGHPRYPHFGPHWAPSGKTAFERLVPTVQDFYYLIQGPWPAPVIVGYDQCSATKILYESFVCALELLEVMGKNFNATPSGIVAKPADFLNSPDPLTNKLELASFFAHTWKETGVYNAFEARTLAPYAVADPVYPPVRGVTYHGRGIMQISWNYNYGPFSEYIFGNKNVLLFHPEMVDPYGPMGVMSAIWFWMSPHDFSGYFNGGAGGHVAPHDAVAHWKDGKMSHLYNTDKYDEAVGFGLSTNIINGGIECTNSTSGHWARVGYFLTVYERLTGEYPFKSASCLFDVTCKGLFAGCGASFSAPTSYERKRGSCNTHTYIK